MMAGKGLSFWQPFRGYVWLCYTLRVYIVIPSPLTSIAEAFLWTTSTSITNTKVELHQTPGGTSKLRFCFVGCFFCINVLYLLFWLCSVDQGLLKHWNLVSIFRNRCFLPLNINTILSSPTAKSILWLGATGKRLRNSSKKRMVSGYFLLPQQLLITKTTIGIQQNRSRSLIVIKSCWWLVYGG